MEHTHTHTYIYIYILEWTRALNAREVSWIRAKRFWPYWLRKTFCQFVVSSCLWSCLLLSCLHLYLLALASLLLCPLVSYAGPPLGLFWASPGPLLGPILGLRTELLNVEILISFQRQEVRKAGTFIDLQRSGVQEAEPFITFQRPEVPKS